MDCDNFLFFIAGLFVVYAYDDISYAKLASQSHTYFTTGYDASNAVDGNPATCMRTQEIGKSAPYKNVWWKVDLGGVYNIYKINILFKNYDGYVDRQKGRFAGFSLYVSDSDVSTINDIKGSTLCYKNEPQLPPLNFTTVCTEIGRYVIYYNERLDGVEYPTGYETTNVQSELCEIIVKGCLNASFYGSNCDIPCPTNCKNNMCHIQIGACSLCKPGWTDNHCDKRCVEGQYGINCSQRCVGHCRDRDVCNHVTGQCDKGCDAGWKGVMCDKECDDGTYGYNCVNNCSGHCLNNSPCHKHTGHCDGGCGPGYTNGDCSKECPTGHYGLDCRDNCSRHCINNEPCDHVSGVCPSGCQDGYIGSHCSNSCKDGLFGTNCSRVCSPNCKPDTCRHSDGWCTCVQGLTTDNCTTEIPERQLMNENMSSSTTLAIGLSVSLLINLIFIVCGLLLCRKVNSNRKDIPSSLPFCRKKPVYEDIVVKSKEASTYQELDLSENVYQISTM